MATGTPRPRQEILDLFEDNSSGAISAQDARDFIASVAGRGASLYVASTGATNLEKAGADYVCDGTADDVQINAAITALGSTGGVVQLSNGNFNIASPILVTTGNISIVGIGRGTILTAINSLNDNILRIAGTTGTMIGNRFERFAVEGNYANQTTGSPIESRAGIYFNGSAGAGLVDPVFRDLFIEYCKGPGLALEGTTLNPVTRPTLDNITVLGCGIGWAADGAHMSYANDAKISNFNGQYNTDTGLALDYCSVVHVTDSVGRANTGNQMTAARQTARASFKGCTMDGLDVGAYGFRTGKFGDGGASSSTFIMLDDCVIINNTTAGMQLDDLTVIQISNTYCPQTGGDANGTSFATTTGLLYPVFSSGNVGIIAQNSGSSTIASGATSKVVSHGLNQNLATAAAISLKHIWITPNEQSTVGRLFAVTAVDSTGFTVTLSGDPGASGWDFSWQARLDT